MLPRNHPDRIRIALMTAAWWPMPGCSFRPPWPGISACPNSSSSASTWAMPRGGRTLATR